MKWIVNSKWFNVLVIIGIIVILVVIIAIPLNWKNEEMLFRNRQRLSDLYSLEFSLNNEIHNMDLSAIPFPKSIKTSSCLSSQAVDGSGWVQFNPAVIYLSQYLKLLPKDPLQPKQCYVFKTSADGKKFKIEAALEPDRDNTAHYEMTDDGGQSDTLLELGSDRKL